MGILKGLMGETPSCYPIYSWLEPFTGMVRDQHNDYIFLLKITK